MKDPLAKLSKEQAIEVAHRAQRARKNDEGRAAKAVQTIMGGGLGALFGGALGYWMGQAEYEYETSEDKEAIDKGDEPDPRKWFGIEKDLVASLVLTGVGIGLMFIKNAKLARVGGVVTAVGLGGLSASLYSRGHTAGYKSLKDAEEDEEETA